MVEYHTRFSQPLLSITLCKIPSAHLLVPHFREKAYFYHLEASWSGGEKTTNKQIHL